MFTAALEKAKAKEMIRYFTEVLNDQLLRINEEDEFSADFDVRGKIREVLQAPLERLLTEILEKCNYDNYVGSRFDEDVCDVVVNGSEKMSQGQGFRAFLNTVMALADPLPQGTRGGCGHRGHLRQHAGRALPVHDRSREEPSDHRSGERDTPLGLFHGQPHPLHSKARQRQVRPHRGLSGLKTI